MEVRRNTIMETRVAQAKARKEAVSAEAFSQWQQWLSYTGEGELRCRWAYIDTSVGSISFSKSVIPADTLSKILSDARSMGYSIKEDAMSVTIYDGELAPSHSGRTVQSLQYVFDLFGAF